MSVRLRSKFESVKFDELLLAELLVLVGEERKEKARETGFVLRRGDRRTGPDGLHEHEQGHEARKGSDVDVGRSAGGSGCGTWYMVHGSCSHGRSASVGVDQVDDGDYVFMYCIVQKPMN